MTIASRIESDWLNARLPAFLKNENPENVEESKSPESQTEQSIDKSRVSKDVASWPCGFGRCPKLPASELTFGKGILIAKFLDLFTQ